MHRKFSRRIVFGAAFCLLASIPFFAGQNPSPRPARNPTNAKASALDHNNLGIAYMDRQDQKNALAEFREAYALDPDLAATRLNQAIALLSLQQFTQAQSILEELAKRDPRNLRVRYNLGLVEKSRGRAQASAADFERVAAIDPGDADTQYFLGQDYMVLLDYAKAIACFETALKTNPFHASAEFALAQSYQRSGDRARAQEHLTRFQYLVQTKLGAPISLTYGEQGKYSLAEEGPQGPERVPPDVPEHFVDVTSQAGLPTNLTRENAQQSAEPFMDSLGGGACVIDYDADGRPDLFFADLSGHAALYHNLGSGEFEDVTARSGIPALEKGMGCAVGDFDNDGRPDIAVSYADGVALLHNDGNGKFSDVTSTAGIHVSGRALGLAFVDYDHDGDLDLFVAQATRDNSATPASSAAGATNSVWRNNGNGTFTEVAQDTGLGGAGATWGAVASDINNDRAIDLIMTAFQRAPSVYFNRREGPFRAEQPWTSPIGPAVGALAFDFDKDGWMDLAFTHSAAPGLSLWRNNAGKNFTAASLPKLDWTRGWGLAALDYDNDGWIDLAAVGENPSGGHIVLLRNEGPAGFRDVSKEVGLDQVHLARPRSVIAADFFGDGAVDLLVTNNGGPPVLLRNQGNTRNHWLKLALNGLNDNKSAIGTKVDILAGTLRQKFEVSGASGYMGQSDTNLNVGLNGATRADIVRMLWPTGVLQDEISLSAGSKQTIAELDRRGSSCPILFAWNGHAYQFIADILGPGIVGHWVAPGKTNFPNPIEYLKVDGSAVQPRNGQLSFRLLEPEEELDYLDRVRLLAVDHPAGEEVYSNGHFSMDPPFPAFHVVATHESHPPVGAWDEHGHNVLPLLLDRDHRFVAGFDGPPFAGFAKLHWVELDLGKWDANRPLQLLLDGFTDYFSASSLYSAWQAGVKPIPPYVEVVDANGQWRRVIDDMGFPAGLERTMTLDLTGKLPPGARRIRIASNLKVYWDRIRIDNSATNAVYRVHDVPLSNARLEFRGFPRYVEGKTPGDLSYIYDEVSASGPYARQSGNYTRYGDVSTLLSAADEKYVVFGAGDEVTVNFDISSLGPLPPGWERDYFFYADGFDKDMDFYAEFGDTVSPFPIHSPLAYPYPGNMGYPADDSHLDYFLRYNVRPVSGSSPASYRFNYRKEGP